ncbi:MAG: amidohydrolase [Bacteroidia bacterium]|nr:amidohydrolase [Bacteroidia bacterium]MBP7437301.1 amidohydrolase [Bacteroidia bacterium]MBP7728216.1 amidohydrolase [Bacteroidia bacterium]MBP7771397.1 amidohydrolase [Bacteroidia bacterium]
MSLRIALLQADLRWEDPTANRDLLSGMIDDIRERPDLIVLPEMFSTGFSMRADELAQTMDGPDLRWMQGVAERTGSTLTGSLIVEENGRYFNRLLWMSPNGLLGLYDKRHLFRLAHEQDTYTAGTTRPVFRINDFRVAPLICYDLRFPVWSRRSASYDYDVLLYVANWPEKRGHAWRSLLPARAIENQSYVAAVNRVGTDGQGMDHRGDSVVLDFRGETISTVEPDSASVLEATLELDPLVRFREQFAFWQDADRFRLE